MLFGHIKQSRHIRLKVADMYLLSLLPIQVAGQFIWFLVLVGLIPLPLLV